MAAVLGEVECVAAVGGWNGFDWVHSSPNSRFDAATQSRRFHVEGGWELVG